MDMLISLEDVWEEYGLDQLQESIGEIFSENQISLKDLLQTVMEGNITGALSDLLRSVAQSVAAEWSGMGRLLVWLLVLGMVSALLNYFIEIFDHAQVADLGFYLMYLLLTAVLLQCFQESLSLARDTLEQLVVVARLLLPAYLMSVGAVSGSATVSATYQLMLLLIYAVEALLAALVLPLISCYVILAVVNGVWTQERLGFLVNLVGKAVRMILRAAVGVVAGISVFQAMITPAVDSLKTSAFQKILSVIPGVGSLTEGTVELMLGAAVIIKNSVGVVAVILLLVLCAVPFLKIFLLAVILKASAAFMGVVGDGRLTVCTDRVGEGGLLLSQTVGTAFLLFLIAIAVLAAATNRGV